MRLGGDWMGADKMHRVKDIMALALRFRVVFFGSCRLILSAWIQWMQTMNQIENKGCRQCTGGWSRLAKVRASGRWVTGAADLSPLTLKEVLTSKECKCSALNILLSWHYCIYRRSAVESLWNGRCWLLRVEWNLKRLECQTTLIKPNVCTMFIANSANSDIF